MGHGAVHVGGGFQTCPPSTRRFMIETTAGKCPKCGVAIPADVAAVVLLLGHGAIEVDDGVWRCHR